MTAIADEIPRHYAASDEDQRLRTGRRRLERLRTMELIERHLPVAPMHIIDVGGASGIYAEALIDIGYRATLFDPVPLHVEQASAAIASKGGRTGADHTHEARAILLEHLRRIESEPSLIGASAHILAVANTPAAP